MPDVEEVLKAAKRNKQYVCGGANAKLPLATDADIAAGNAISVRYDEDTEAFVSGKAVAVDDEIYRYQEDLGVYMYDSDRKRSEDSNAKPCFKFSNGVMSFDPPRYVWSERLGKFLFLDSDRDRGLVP